MAVDNSILGALLKGVKPDQMPAMESGETSLNALQQVMAGNLAGQLTTADKLAGLSALMRSVTRGGRQAGLTPEAAIQGVQQQAMGRIQGQLQLEQLRALETQRKQQAAAEAQFAGTLPPEKQKLWAGLDTEGRQAMLKEYMMPQPFQITEEGGKRYMTFRNGETRELSGIPQGVKLREVNDGRTIRLIDENTKQVWLETPALMSLAQLDASARGWALVRNAEVNTQLRAREGGGSTAKGPQPSRIRLPNGTVTYGTHVGGFNFKLVDGRVTQATPASSSDGGAAGAAGL